MAYNPNLYSPYGSQQFQPTIGYMPQQYQPTVQQQQPVNGLIFIDKNAVDTYQMPPGSVSPPLFIDDSHYVIKSFDSNGGSSIEPFRTEPCSMSEIFGADETNVTKADLEAFKLEIMEALNDKHTIQDIPTTSTIATGTA